MFRENSLFFFCTFTLKEDLDRVLLVTGWLLIHFPEGSGSHLIDRELKTVVSLDTYGVE